MPSSVWLHWGALVYFCRSLLTNAGKQKARGSASCRVKSGGLPFVLCTALMGVATLDSHADSEMNDKGVSLSQVPTLWHKTRLAFKGRALWLPAAVLCYPQSPGEQ